MLVISFFLLIATSVLKAEERLSWSTKDDVVRRSIFVPDDLPEGKEESRALPWVFHDDEQTKVMKLNCIMRGYNVTNNPINYKDARWSHPGFDDSQVNTAFPREEGTENGVPYAIWSIEITTSALAHGKKYVTCEFQQGDFPLSIDLKFLIFRRISKESLDSNKTFISYGLEDLEEKDLSQKIEEDIKRQIKETYDTNSSNVTREGMIFTITVLDPNQLTPITTKVMLPLCIILVIVCGCIMATKDRMKIKFGLIKQSDTRADTTEEVPERLTENVPHDITEKKNDLNKENPDGSVIQSLLTNGKNSSTEGICICCILRFGPIIN